MADSLLNRLKTLFFGGETEAPRAHSQDVKRERYLEYDVAQPKDRCEYHDRCWTSADGIWYCYDCHKWFRVWEDEQYRPKRQGGGLRD